MRRNWQQVMGKDPRLWLLPVYGGGPDGDGIHGPSPFVKSSSAVVAAAEQARVVTRTGEASRPRSAHDESAALEEGRLLAGRGELSDSSAEE